MTDEHELVKTLLSVIINPGKSLTDASDDFLKICRIQQLYVQVVTKQVSSVSQADVLLGIVPDVEEAVWSAIQMMSVKFDTSNFKQTQLNINMLFLLFIRQ